MKMAKIPVFKKKVNAFLTSEEGKITKQSMLIAGGVLGAIAAGSLGAKFAEGGEYDTTDPGQGTDSTPSSTYSHRNSADYDYTGGSLKVQHNHHYNHGSHASHGSHSNY